MPRKLPKYVERVRVKGRNYFYFRRDKSSPRIALPDPGDPAFSEAYGKALIGDAVRVKEQRASQTPGTIAALIASYMRSASFVQLRATTKTGYLSRLEALRVVHGHRTVKGMTRAGIAKGILEPYADRPGAALSILKMLRILIRHAIETDVLDRDPSLGIKRPRTQEIRSWSDDEISRFEAKWPVGSKQRLAFALVLFTGQRRSDVHRMTWADIDGPSIRVVQQKTSAKLTIPLHRELRAVLAAAPRDHVTILNTAYGRPFSVDGFSGFMRDAIAEAKLPLSCQPHGLRKAAGRRLAEAGASANQIMAVLGHKSLAEAERYTREADQQRLARGAIAKLQGRKTNKKSQTPPEKFGEGAEKDDLGNA